VTGSGRLAGIDVADNDDVDVGTLGTAYIKRSTELRVLRTIRLLQESLVQERGNIYTTSYSARGHLEISYQEKKSIVH
jgi:hypothetical protein